ncbi:MAG: 30S ribosome-binding factor RbfA [Elusimicrobia bacterium]|nr:30S ribosome-binding factor RbfA [Elusimicrobiota bacterium]
MYKRDDRITALLQQELAELLRSVKDPGISGFVTLTGVALSADRKRASAYISVFGDEREKESTLKALQRAAEFLRYQLKGRLQMRVIPFLDFKADETAERAQRIEEILGHLETEKDSPGGEPPPKPQRPKRPKIK